PRRPRNGRARSGERSPGRTWTASRLDPPPGDRAVASREAAGSRSHRGSSFREACCRPSPGSSYGGRLAHGVADPRALLHTPFIAVRITEEDERIPVLALAFGHSLAGVVLDGADFHSPGKKIGSRGLDIGDAELQALQRARLHLGQ